MRRGRWVILLLMAVVALSLIYNVREYFLFINSKSWSNESAIITRASEGRNAARFEVSGERGEVESTKIGFGIFTRFSAFPVEGAQLLVWVSPDFDKAVIYREYQPANWFFNGLALMWLMMFSCALRFIWNVDRK